MKPIPKPRTDLPPLLAFGAHPDDIEFGCGGVIAKETRIGRKVNLIVCSLGESATHGKPAQRKREAKNAAAILGAGIEFIDVGGDAHLEMSVENALELAKILRRHRPGIVLGPSCVENQHPDHFKLGRLLQDASRLARFGGVRELRSLAPHAIGHLLFYAHSPHAEPGDISPLLIDISDPAVVTAWIRAMNAHDSQTRAREYVELQLNRSRLRGLSAGVSHAIALFPNDPLVIDSLAMIQTSARRF